MQVMVFKLLDVFFVAFHTLLIAFNLFGWIWWRTRKANLIALLLTGISWIGLGLFFGIGYCPLTDWHWQVLGMLGSTPEVTSYVAYLLNRIAGIVISKTFADWLTTSAYLVALSLSVYTNFFVKVKKG